MSRQQLANARDHLARLVRTITRVWLRLKREPERLEPPHPSEIDQAVDDAANASSIERAAGAQASRKAMGAVEERDATRPDR